MKTIKIALCWIHMTICYFMYKVIKNSHINVSNNRLACVCHIGWLSIILTKNSIIHLLLYKTFLIFSDIVPFCIPCPWWGITVACLYVWRRLRVCGLIMIPMLRKKIPFNILCIISSAKEHFQCNYVLFKICHINKNKWF